MTGLRVIRAGEMSGDTAQTSGMSRSEAIPGDFVWVPPELPHREENPDPGAAAVVVIARSTQEAIVVNVDSL